MLHLTFEQFVAICGTIGRDCKIEDAKLIVVPVMIKLQQKYHVLIIPNDQSPLSTAKDVISRCLHMSLFQ